MEAAIIRASGAFKNDILDGACQQRQVQVLVLKFRTLNRASGLERGGDLWTSETGAAERVAMQDSWAKQMGPPAGSNVQTFAFRVWKDGGNRSKVS